MRRILDSHESGAERTGGLDEQAGDADVAAEGVGVLPKVCMAVTLYIYLALIWGR